MAELIWSLPKWPRTNQKRIIMSITFLPQTSRRSNLATNTSLKCSSSTTISIPHHYHHYHHHYHHYFHWPLPPLPPGLAIAILRSIPIAVSSIITRVPCRYYLPHHHSQSLHKRTWKQHIFAWQSTYSNGDVSTLLFIHVLYNSERERERERDKNVHKLYCGHLFTIRFLSFIFLPDDLCG